MTSSFTFSRLKIKQFLAPWGLFRKFPLFLIFFFILLGFKSDLFGVSFNIFHLNDTHGHFFGIKEKEMSRGGAAEMAFLIKKFKKKYGASGYIIHAGDLFSRAEPMTIYSRGATNIAILNSLGIDLFVPGNGEFYFTLHNLKNQLKKANFSTVCGNLLQREDSEPPFAPYKIHKVEGVRVALVGFTFVHTNIPSGYEIILENPEQAFKRIAQELKEKADLVIVVTHIGLEKDKKLVSQTEGIDLVIGGHSHELTQVPVMVENRVGKKIPIVQGGDYFRSHGILNLDISKGGLKMVKFQGVEISVGSEKDIEMGGFLKEKSEELQVPLFYSPASFTPPMTEKMVLEAMHEKTGQPVVILDVTAVRGVLPKGRVTLDNLCRIHPWRNRLMKNKFSRGELKSALLIDGVRWRGLSVVKEFLRAEHLPAQSQSEFLEVVYPEFVHSKLPFLTHKPIHFLGYDLLEVIQERWPVNSLFKIGVGGHKGQND